MTYYWKNKRVEIKAFYKWKSWHMGYFRRGNNIVITPFVHTFCNNPCPLVRDMAWLPSTYMQLTDRIRVNAFHRSAENWTFLISKIMEDTSVFPISLLSAIWPLQVASAIENKEQWSLLWTLWGNPTFPEWLKVNLFKALMVWVNVEFSWLFSGCNFSVPFWKQVTAVNRHLS